jgi:hypothetical protein
MIVVYQPKSVDNLGFDQFTPGYLAQMNPHGWSSKVYSVEIAPILPGQFGGPADLSLDLSYGYALKSPQQWSLT